MTTSETTASGITRTINSHGEVFAADNGTPIEFVDVAQWNPVRTRRYGITLYFNEGSYECISFDREGKTWSEARESALHPEYTPREDCRFIRTRDGYTYGGRKVTKIVVTTDTRYEGFDA